MTDSDDIEDEDSGIRQISCSYRGENGTRCAVGILIPDELYDPEMDAGGGCNALCLRGYTGVGDILCDINDGLLRAMQIMHDKDPIAVWPDRVKEIAHNMCLTVPTVDWSKCLAGETEDGS